MPSFLSWFSAVLLSDTWLSLGLGDLSVAQKVLLAFGALMVAVMLPVYLLAQFDARTLRDIGVWAKPLKFMAATALFAWTTVWLTQCSGTSVGRSEAFNGVAALIIVTSLLEVAYITWQAAHAQASHYNTADPLHALLYGVMGLVALALTASQAWLAWLIWTDAQLHPPALVQWGVLGGLVLTFVLSSVSGFLLGGHQAPPGVGLPVLGWHMRQDLRPAHFLGLHAQQFIPLAALLAERALGKSPAATSAWASFTALYVLLCATLTWWGLAS